MIKCEICQCNQMKYAGHWFLKYGNTRVGYGIYSQSRVGYGIDFEKWLP